MGVGRFDGMSLFSRALKALEALEADVKSVSEMDVR